MPRLAITLLAAAAVLCCAATASAQTLKSQWRDIGRAAARSLASGDGLKAKTLYRQALEAARAEHASTEVLIDLELNIAQSQITNLELEDAEKTLATARKEIETNKLTDSIVALHHARRVRDLRRSQHEKKLTIEADRNVLGEIRKHFANSEAYQEENLELAKDAVKALDFPLACATIKEFNEYWQKRTKESNPQQAMYATRWLAGELTQQYENAIRPGMDITQSKIVSWMKLVPGSTTELFNMWARAAKTKSPDNADSDYTVQRTRELFAQLPKPVSQDETKALRAALVANFWRHLRDHKLHPELEETIKAVIKIGLPTDEVAGAVLNCQMTGVYGEMLAKEGRLDEAEKVLSSFHPKPGIFSAISDLDGIVLGRQALTQQYANRKQWQKAHEQTLQLEALLKTQPHIPNTKGLVDAWRNSEKIMTGNH